MDQNLKSIAGIFLDKLPSIAAAINLPFLGLGAEIVAAIGQHFLGNPDASAAEVAKAVQADPVAAVEALKPLDDHLATVTAAAATGASTVPQGALPGTTETVKESIEFATNDVDYLVTPQDAQGGRVVMQWFSEKDFARYQKAVCAAAMPERGKS